MAGLLASDSVMAAWWATRVECSSALRRRDREGTISPAAGVRRGLARLGTLSEAWTGGRPRLPPQGAEAERALAVHPLRGADALQLAAALIWRAVRPAPHEFVCLDERLRDAAAREGSALVPSEDD